MPDEADAKILTAETTRTSSYNAV